jgi:diguanylate cyclase (GGDEF)-like protein
MPYLPESRRKISLLTLSALLVLTVWVAGGVALWITLQQQALIEAEAQHIQDVSSAKVFEATRTIRSIERLAREGDAILWIEDQAELRRRLQSLQTLQADAALQGDSDLRELVARGFLVIDGYMTQREGRGAAKARAEAVQAWQPLMQDLINRSEAEGAAVSDLATQEADRILASTERAREVFLLIAASGGAASIVFFVLLYRWLARPVVRLARSMVSAREGHEIGVENEAVMELQTLQDAAVALGSAHKSLDSLSKQMERLAHTDALTGLPNRRSFQAHCQQSFAYAKRYGTPLTLLLLDIDHFKRINDQYGHEGGDLVLKALGNFLLHAARASDQPASRIGGEEFGIVLFHSAVPQAIEFADRLRASIAKLQIPAPGVNGLQVSVSVGIAALTADDADMDALMRRADVALYRAKDRGRNRVECEPELPPAHLEEA